MNRNLTNYHSHTLYCDGHAHIETFINEAIKEGFYSYGVSPHAPLPWATRWTMLECELPVFIYEMEQLRQKYKGQIELYTGMEIDYIDEKLNPQAGIFRKARLNYRIGSVHLLYNRKGELVDVDLHPDKFTAMLSAKFDNDAEGLIDNYFSHITAMLETGGFDIVGHIDKISYNIESCRKGITQSAQYLGYIEKVLSLVKAKGYILEINTKAYERHGVTYLGTEHFHYIKEMNIPVTVNSDSHYPSLINAGREYALARLKEAGISHVMELRSNRWTETEISI